MSLLLTSAVTASSYADIIPPNQQKKIGISTEDIVCESGLFKVIREKTNSIACVKPSSVAKLVSNGWAKQIDEKLLSDALNRKNIELGTINILEKVPVRTNVGKLATGAPINGYNLIFEVCATIPIYAPDVLIRSDSESKNYELIETVNAGTCVISASKIKAADANTITVTLLNKGDISAKVLSLQNELDSLKKQLAEVKSSFGIPASSDVQNQGIKITELRKQVNDKREELHRILFTLHSPPTVKAKLDKFTFTGKVIEGESTTILSVLDSQTPGQFDVVFEACAGEKTVRLPVVNVISDEQSTTVKIGDKISANSCQMSFAKINAKDKSTITVSNAENESSGKAADLEVLIVSLEHEMVQEKELLKELMHNPARAENFAELLDAHVTKITELRNQITSAKAEYSKILYLTYN
ncbi:hypothetical protein [Nitrosopumilus sp. S4]